MAARRRREAERLFLTHLVQSIVNTLAAVAASLVTAEGKRLNTHGRRMVNDHRTNVQYLISAHHLTKVMGKDRRLQTERTIVGKS